MSLKAVVDELVAVESTIHPTLHVYRWWRPDMALPAVWNWMTPGEVRRRTNCPPDDVIRLTMSLGVDPTAIAGEGDMLELEAYFDLAVPVLNQALYERRPFNGVAKNAARLGSQTVTDRLGDAVVLCLEVPLEITLAPPPGGITP
jgi:hypothetical protein